MISNILAVQKERDRLGKQRTHHFHSKMSAIKSTGYSSGDLDDDDDDLSIMALLKAEQTAKEVNEKKMKYLFNIPNFLFSILVDKFNLTDIRPIMNVFKLH